MLDTLDAIRAERKELLAELADRERVTRDQLTAAQQSADNYERALLTRKDDPLVPPVIQTLTELGFTVVDADSDPAETENLEDLRVTDPAHPGWFALVEVKGYIKGAQTSALTQFIRFTRRYRQRTGSDPDALWYVANQFKDRDPGSRQRILQSNEADIAVFAHSGGLVIDTVQLFRLIDATRIGKLTAVEARDTLRGATGRYVFDPATASAEVTDPPAAHE